MEKNEELEKRLTQLKCNEANKVYNSMTHSINSNNNKKDSNNISFGSQCIHYFLSNFKLIN
jgi:hypothetical protein